MSGVDLKKTILQILEKLKAVETRELLWENQHPDSAFSAQTVFIDSIRDFDYIEIEFSNYLRLARTTVKAFPDFSGNVEAVSASIGVDGERFWLNRRYFNIDSSGINFLSGGYKKQDDTKTIGDDECMVPLKIYGIRKIGNRA